jgi:hypothetical protein
MRSRIVSGVRSARRTDVSWISYYTGYPGAARALVRYPAFQHACHHQNEAGVGGTSRGRSRRIRYVSRRHIRGSLPARAAGIAFHQPTVAVQHSPRPLPLRERLSGRATRFAHTPSRPLVLTARPRPHLTPQTVASIPQRRIASTPAPPDTCCLAAPSRAGPPGRGSPGRRFSAPSAPGIPTHARTTHTACLGRSA